MNRILWGRDSSGRASWAIEATPDVAMRLRRIFPRAVQSRGGVIVIRATPETARDLEWVTARWPFDMDPGVEKRLRDAADAHRATETAVGDILAGHLPPDSWREPAIPFRPYQQAAAAVVHRTGRLLLMDPLGSGKSASAIAVLRNPDALPVLIVALTHLPAQWAGQVKKFTPWLNTHIATRGTPYPLPDGTDVVIMGYSKLRGWAGALAGRVNTVIFDEAQELRTGPTSDGGSLRYDAAAMIADRCRYRIETTATPVYNYGDEIFNLIEVLEPGLLGSRDEFLREWCTPAGSGHHAVKDPRALGSHLRAEGIVLRRSDLGEDLPPAHTLHVNVESDAAVLERAAADLGVQSFAEALLRGSSSFTERGQAARQFDMRMRQATGIAKAPQVARFVRIALDDVDGTPRPKLILFGWHRAVYDIWLRELADLHPILYTGSENTRAKLHAEDRFLHDPTRRLLIMSLRSGAGLDGLQAVARVVVFGELDWSPEVHGQCVGRVRRDGMLPDQPALAYYLTSDDGSDPTMLDTLGVKRRQSEPMLDPFDAPRVQQVDARAKVRQLAQQWLAKHS